MLPGSVRLAECVAGVDVEWACRDRYLWIHVASSQRPRFEAVGQFLSSSPELLLTCCCRPPPVPPPVLQRHLSCTCTLTCPSLVPAPAPVTPPPGLHHPWAPDANGVHAIGEQLASRCGYTISSFTAGGFTTFKASYYSCFTLHQVSPPPPPVVAGPLLH